MVFEHETVETDQPVRDPRPRTERSVGFLVFDTRRQGGPVVASLRYNWRVPVSAIEPC